MWTGGGRWPGWSSRSLTVIVFAGRNLITVRAKSRSRLNARPPNIYETNVEDCTDSTADCTHDRREIAKQISRALWRASADLPRSRTREPDRRTHGLQRGLGDASRDRLLCLGWYLCSKRSQRADLFRKFFRQRRP